MKADVYSFGVVILEVVSGKGSVDAICIGGSQKLLVEWVGLLTSIFFIQQCFTKCTIN